MIWVFSKKHMDMSKELACLPLLLLLLMLMMIELETRCSADGYNKFSRFEAAQFEETEGGVTEEDPPIYSGSLSSTRTQLDLLEQLTSISSSVDGYASDGSSRKLTIRDQLAQLVGNRDDDFSIPLGKNLKNVSPKLLTISQKRNIRRQAYLDEVSQRNDTVFFATIGAFKYLPGTAVTEAMQKFQFLSAAARWLNCWFGIGWELRSIVVEIDVHCRWFVY